MSTTKIEILDCPFCKSSSFSIDDIEGEELFFVSCESCGAAGPLTSNKITAVQVWNSAQRTKASISITGDSLHDVFSQFTSIVLSSIIKKEEDEEE